MRGEVCCCCCSRGKRRERELMNDPVCKQETRSSTTSSTRNKPFTRRSSRLVVVPSAFFCDDDAVGVGKLTGTEELTFARIFYRVLLLRVPRCFASVLSLTFGQNNSGSCANRALFSSQLQNKPIRIFSTTWSGSLVPYCNKLLTFHRLQRQGVQT